MLIPASALALGLGAVVQAQDSTVKSRTQVKTDDASAIVMTGCLQAVPGSDGFTLTGAVASAGKEAESKSKIKTDVDKDDTTVKGKTRTEIEHGDHSVGTSGLSSTYAVTPRAGVDLAAHVNEHVEITAVMVDAAKKGGDDDAKVKVNEKTKADNEDAPDAKAKSTTKIEVPRGPLPRLMAMSVKTIGPSCSGQ
jgi:hypothetical protein